MYEPSYDLPYNISTKGKSRERKREKDRETQRKREREGTSAISHPQPQPQPSTKSRSRALAAPGIRAVNKAEVLRGPSFCTRQPVVHCTSTVHYSRPRLRRHQYYYYGPSYGLPGSYHSYSYSYLVTAWPGLQDLRYLRRSNAWNSIGTPEASTLPIRITNSTHISSVAATARIPHP